MTPSPTSGSQDGRCRLAWWTLALALICGGILRSIWIEDMEWKKDEQWSYRMSQEVGRTRPWPSVGMPTSLGVPESRAERVDLRADRSNGEHADVDGARDRVAEHDRPDRVCRGGPRLPPCEGARALALGAGAASGQSLRHPPVEEDLAAVDLDAIAAAALDQPSAPSGPLGCLHVGPGRCLDRPGAPERLVRGGGPGHRHRGRRMPGQPAQIALLALVALRHRSGPDRCPPLGTHLPRSPLSPPAGHVVDRYHEFASIGYLYGWRRARRACFLSSILGLGLDTQRLSGRSDHRWHTDARPRTAEPVHRRWRSS